MTSGRLSLDSQDEKCPAAGLGTWITFNVGVGYDEAVRASCAEIMRQDALPYHGGQGALRTGAVACVRPFSRLLFALGCRAVPHTPGDNPLANGHRPHGVLSHRQSVEGLGWEQRLPAVCLEAVLEQIGGTQAALDFVRSPSTTAISLRPSRVALATTLKPLSQMNPVFMPSAPA